MKKVVKRWICFLESSQNGILCIAGWGMYPKLFMTKKKALMAGQKGKVFVASIMIPEKYLQK